MTGNQGYLLNALKTGGRDAEIAFSSGAASADGNLAKSYANMPDSGLQRLVPNGNVIVSNREPNSRCTSGAGKQRFASSRGGSPDSNGGTFDKQQEQVRALKDLFGDGSLNEVLFPGYLAQAQSNDYAAFERDSQDSDESVEDDQNSLVIKMLGSMLAKPKSNAECQAINRPIDLQKLKEDLREMALAELA